MDTIFEQATRGKVRFPHKGQISTEDLWDLQVEELDTIFKTLNAQLRASKEDSLLEKRSVADEILTLKVNIVKYIVATKLTEDEERKTRAAKLAKKREIMAVLADKQAESLKGMSEADLMKMLEEL